MHAKDRKIRFRIAVAFAIVLLAVAGQANWQQVVAAVSLAIAVFALFSLDWTDLDEQPGRRQSNSKQNAALDEEDEDEEENEERQRSNSCRRPGSASSPLNCLVAHNGMLAAANSPSQLNRLMRSARRDIRRELKKKCGGSSEYILYLEMALQHSNQVRPCAGRWSPIWRLADSLLGCCRRALLAAFLSLSGSPIEHISSSRICEQQRGHHVTRTQ